MEFLQEIILVFHRGEVKFAWKLKPASPILHTNHDISKKHGFECLPENV